MVAPRKLEFEPGESFDSAALALFDATDEWDDKPQAEIIAEFISIYKYRGPDYLFQEEPTDLDTAPDITLSTTDREVIHTKLAAYLTRLLVRSLEQPDIEAILDHVFPDVVYYIQFELKERARGQNVSSILSAVLPEAIATSIVGYLQAYKKYIENTAAFQFVFDLTGNTPKIMADTNPNAKEKDSESLIEFDPMVKVDKDSQIYSVEYDAYTIYLTLDDDAAKIEIYAPRDLEDRQKVTNVYFTLQRKIDIKALRRKLSQDDPRAAREAINDVLPEKGAF